MRNSRIILILLILPLLVGLHVIFLNNSPAYAQLGVSINLGKITVDDPLMPGGSYTLPSIGVRNSGSIASNYEMEVTYKEIQSELKPPDAWIEFDPKFFNLDTGDSQNVGVVLNIPINAEPGDYFAYLEVHPVTDESAIAIGIAAATKLYFTVKPSGFISSVVNKISNFFEDYSPFSWLGLAIVIIIIISLILWRFVHISFSIKRKK